MDHRNGPRFQPRMAALILAIVALGLVAASFPPLAREAAAKSASWSEYNTTLDVHADGTMTVTEDQVIAFEGGPFTHGYATIPLGRIENISNILVLENGVPYKPGNNTPGAFSTTNSGSQMDIDWWFTPTSDENRSFTIRYDVTGALRVYADRQQLWWRVIDTDFAGNVDSATITVNLPQAVAEDQLSVAWYASSGSSFPVDWQVTSPTQVIWRATSINQGEALEARLEFPPITSATAPAWQAADDAERAREERLAPYKALLNVLLLAGGLLLLVGGSVGVLMLWFSRGRDVPVVAPIDLLKQPPDDLPAAAVGALVDERANDCDVIAGIISLAGRGVLRIEEKQPGGVLGGLGFGSRDFTFYRLESNITLRPFEQELLGAIFTGSQTEARLSTIRTRFSDRQALVKKGLYDELVGRGYFDRNPQTTRHFYRGAGALLLVASTAGGLLLCVLIGSFAPFVVVPVIGAAVVGLLLMIVGGSMPRKTQAGAEAAARWQAFRRYLADIERYDSVADAKALFDQYLPYAIAFGLERSWVSKFAQAGAPAPTWYGGWDGPVQTGRMPRGPRGGAVIIVPGGRPGGGGGGGGGLPDLQQTSDRMAGSLQSMSNGLFDLFSEAGKVFSPPPSSGGGGGGRSGGFGGFSGGGGSFGGGGGGGGRGFN
ncbi:MAG TPA: DUF2207 domain-containing protein [Thermomicrobiales bacterium]|nr:DUF2207 domain-containing protein [Thermomicrobiales bacterium]